jgi:hypothetical protein
MSPRTFSRITSCLCFGHRRLGVLICHQPSIRCHVSCVMCQCHVSCVMCKIQLFSLPTTRQAFMHYGKLSRRRTANALKGFSFRPSARLIWKETTKTAEITNCCVFECVPFFLGSKIEPKKTKKLLKLKRKRRLLSCGGM